jgi:hypothetical protein
MRIVLSTRHGSGAFNKHGEWRHMSLNASCTTPALPRWMCRQPCKTCFRERVMEFLRFVSDRHRRCFVPSVVYCTCGNRVASWCSLLRPHYKFTRLYFQYGSRDSVVGIATGYGLDDRGVGVRVPVGLRILSSPSYPSSVFMDLCLIKRKKNFRPPLWSSGQSFWLQIQRSQVRFPALPDFLRSLERGPLSLVRTIEELLEWEKVAAPV